MFNDNDLITTNNTMGSKMAIETTYVHYDYMTIGIRHDGRLQQILSDISMADDIAENDAYQLMPASIIFLNRVMKEADHEAWKTHYDKVWISNVSQLSLEQKTDCFHIRVKHNVVQIRNKNRAVYSYTYPINDLPLSICPKCGNPFRGITKTNADDEIIEYCEHCEQVITEHKTY